MLKLWFLSSHGSTTTWMGSHPTSPTSTPCPSHLLMSHQRGVLNPTLQTLMATWPLMSWTRTSEKINLQRPITAEAAHRSVTTTANRRKRREKRRKLCGRSGPPARRPLLPFWCTDLPISTAIMMSSSIQCRLATVSPWIKTLSAIPRVYAYLFDG